PHKFEPLGPGRWIRNWFEGLHSVRWARRRILASRGPASWAPVLPPTSGKPESEEQRKDLQARQAKYVTIVANGRLAIYAEPTFPAQAVEKTRQYLTRMSAVLVELHVPLVVLAIPDEVQVHPDVLRFVLRNARRPDAELDLELPQRKLAEILASLGVPEVDVLREFRRAGAQTRLYRPWD